MKGNILVTEKLLSDDSNFNEKITIGHDSCEEKVCKHNHLNSETISVIESETTEIIGGTGACMVLTCVFCWGYTPSSSKKGYCTCGHHASQHRK